MTNWEKYFGTPEKMAKFLDDLAESFSYCVCINLLGERESCERIYETDTDCRYGNGSTCSLNHLKWLNEEADDE